MSRLLLLGALLGAPSLAAAEPVALPFEAPESFPLFESARLFDVRGKAKSGCEAAAADAVAQAEDKAEKKGYPVVLGLYVESPRDDWTPAKSAPCGSAGKNATVDLTVLAVEPGEGFPWVSGERGLAIVSQLTSDSGVLPTPVTKIRLVAFSGYVFYRLTTDHDETFHPSVDRPGRALTALREDIEPYLDTWMPRLEGIPEITGLLVEVSLSLQQWGDATIDPNASDEQAAGIAMHGEKLEYYIPTAAGLAFVAGDLHERGLADASGIFVEPAEKGQRIDVSSRASEQISGPTLHLVEEGAGPDLR